MIYGWIGCGKLHVGDYGIEELLIKVQVVGTAVQALGEMSTGTGAWESWM